MDLSYIILEAYYTLRSARPFMPTHDGFAIWRMDSALHALEVAIRNDWTNRVNSLPSRLAGINGKTIDDQMTAKDWLHCVEVGGFVDDDGNGYLATATHQSSILIMPSYVSLLEVKLPSWATHIVWCNK